MKIRKYRNHNNTLWYPPELDCPKTTERVITKIHDLLYGKDWCVIDSLGHKQILYIMFEDLPFSWLIKFFIETETIIKE